MSNGIRQGSILSPYLFNVYVDNLIRLNHSGVGCHVDDMAANNLAYADDLVILAPCAAALNELVAVCENFAKDNYITFSVNKSVVTCILPKNLKLRNIPSVYLGGSKLVYVESFNYLGHTITTKFTDDEDIKKEMRKLCARGNTLIRKFKFCQSTTKCNLFRTYCYSLYCSALWSSLKRETLIRLKS